ncbi:unnamed protein product [Rotaria sordida]|uniref:F-box domain-containing protein n=1 Tax=Rotaria sordida TaxID=392033 RepID=A0A819PAN7_9BILA|nr:unnamed protein product [Rotaria sordida]
MDTSNNNRLNILDLPNEILLNIISKLSFIDVFYSLVDINERFYQLAVDPLYIRHLDMAVMTMKSLFEYTSSVDDQVLSKICENILPFIHSQVYKLTLEQHSIERILLNGSYPKLYSISLVNFQKEKLFHYLTVRFNSNVIDGIQLHDEILIHMPRLNKFTFSINTKLLIENDIKTDITTKEDIQHSFIGKEFGQNVLPQQKKQHSSSLITFRHLILLNLAQAHVDYAEEFLVDKNIHLPCLLNLRIKFESLEMVTKNFTNDATHLTCAKLKKLHIDDRSNEIIRTKETYALSYT